MTTLPTPPSVVRRRYDEISGTYASMYEGEGPLPHFYQTRLRHVSRLLEERPPGLLLDVGSGPGVFGERAVAVGFRYVAADVSLGMAREVRKRCEHDAVSTVASVDVLPFADGAFDVVTALGVLEYVQFLDVAIEECHRVLRPDGDFIVSLLNQISPYRIALRMRLRLGRDSDKVPPAHFRRSRALGLLRAKGFRVVRVMNFDMEMLPPGFAGEHPRVWKRVVTMLEPLSDTPLGRLSSAMLIHARRQ